MSIINPYGLKHCSSYTICDDLLKFIGHRTYPQVQMSDAKVMTTATISARYYGGNHQNPCSLSGIHLMVNRDYLYCVIRSACFNRPQRVVWVSTVGETEKKLPGTQAGE